MSHNIVIGGWRRTLRKGAHVMRNSIVKYTKKIMWIVLRPLRTVCRLKRSLKKAVYEKVQTRRLEPAEASPAAPIVHPDREAVSTSPDMQVPQNRCCLCSQVSWQTSSPPPPYDECYLVEGNRSSMGSDRGIRRRASSSSNLLFAALRNSSARHPIVTTLNMSIGCQAIRAATSCDKTARLAEALLLLLLVRFGYRKQVVIFVVTSAILSVP
jgi:hypothetical protein